MAYYFVLPKVTDLTREQQMAVEETLPIIVTGAPGTGKSLVLLWRHLLNYDQSIKKSVLLTYTKTLEFFLKQQAAALNRDSAENIFGATVWSPDKSSKPYDEVIIDEAQDLSLIQVEKLAQTGNSLSLGADAGQVLYPEHSLDESDIDTLKTGREHYDLTENFRNTYQILLFASKLFPGRIIHHDTLEEAKKRQGPKPKLFVCDQRTQQSLLEEVLEAFNSETHNIGILLSTKIEVDELFELLKSKFTCTSYTFEGGLQHSDPKYDDKKIKTIENIHITTMKSAKGAEFDTVILPNFEKVMEADTLRYRDESEYYVAITRTKRNLFMFSRRPLLSTYINQGIFDYEEK